MRHPLNWLIRLGRSADDTRALLGDLEETFRSEVRPHRSWLGAQAWYLRQLLLAAWFASADHVRPIRGSRSDGRQASRTAAFGNLGSLGSDVRQALRALRQHPWSTATIIVTLALGIGASAAVYAVFNYALLRPIPGVADESAMVSMRIRENLQSRSETAATFAHLVAVREMPAFEHLAAYTRGAYPVRRHANDDPRMANLEVVSRGFFGAVGATPTLGRLFADDEYETSGNPIAVISEHLWRSRFGSDPDIVGAEVLIVDQPFTVIGVVRQFRGLARVGDDDVWVPLASKGRLMSDSKLYPQHMVGRRAAGVSLETARAQAAAAFEGVGLVRQGDMTFTAVVFPGVSDGIGLTTSRMRDLFIMAGAGSALLLLLACANVAGLLISRNLTRRRDVSLKVALGASRLRLFRELCIEVAAIATVAAGVGLVTAQLLVVLFRSFRLTSYMPPLVDLTLDWRVVAFAVITAMVTVVLAGVLPSALAARTQPQSGLRHFGRGVSRSTGVRQALTIAQVALSLALVAGAAVLGQSLSELRSVDLGFNPEHLFTLELSPRDVGREPARAFFDEVQRRLSATPGIDAVAFAQFGHMGSRIGASVQLGPETPAYRTDQHLVSADYLDALGIPLLAGRMLTGDETAGSSVASPVVIDEAMARQLFGERSPLGESLYTTWPELHQREIVGVVGSSVSRKLREGHVPTMYVAAGDLRIATLHVRSSLPPTEAAATIRRVVRDLEPQLSAERIETADMVIDGLASEERVLARLALVLAAIALALAASGIYAAIAFGVSERTREFGIRMALGASRPTVGWQVITGTLSVISVGLASGLGLYVWVSRYLETRLFGISALDARVLIGACAILIVAALTAAWFPARRATRVDPTIALRAE